MIFSERFQISNHYWRLFCLSIVATFMTSQCKNSTIKTKTLFSIHAMIGNLERSLLASRLVGEPIKCARLPPFGICD